MITSWPCQYGLVVLQPAAMPNISPVKYTTAFQMRADAEFLDALDALRLAEKPALSRADFLRRLVFEEAKRAERRK